MTDTGWWTIGVGFVLCLIYLFYQIAFPPECYEDEEQDFIYEEKGKNRK